MEEVPSTRVMYPLQAATRTQDGHYWTYFDILLSLFLNTVHHHFWLYLNVKLYCVEFEMAMWYEREGKHNFTLVSSHRTPVKYVDVITYADSVGPSKVWSIIKDDYQRNQLLVSLNWMLFFVSGWSWVDDKRVNGWTISGCGIFPSHFYSKQSYLHRPTNQNKIWLSYYNGWRKKINVFYCLLIIVSLLSHKVIHQIVPVSRLKGCGYTEQKGDVTLCSR